MDSEYQKNQKEDRRKWKSRAATTAAVAKGILKQQPCLVCGSPNTEIHHPNYDKPLEIEWLCIYHHRQKHSKLKTTIQCTICKSGNTYSTAVAIVCRKCGHREPREKGQKERPCTSRKIS